MMENDKDIEKATSQWLKKMEPEEPSAGFSRDVMKSVYALSPEKETDGFSFWWFLLFIPALAVAGWYFNLLPAIASKLTRIWYGMQEYYLSLNTGLGEVLGRFKSISISPAVILIFLAVLSLLIIEDVFSKSRQNLKADT